MARIRIYLDNCTYNRPFDNQSQIRISLEAQAKLHIQKLILNKDFDLVCSYLSIYENSENPNPEHRISIQSFLSNATEFIGIDKAEKIEKLAESIKEFSIKSNDAIHIACAIEGNCKYFITTDDGILKNYKGTAIKVYSPIDFISEVNHA